MFGLFKKTPASPPPVSPVIDLARLICDDLKIGAPVPLGSPYSAHLIDDKDEAGVQIYRNEASGIEITTSGGLVDSIFISLKSFSGRFTLNDSPLALGLDSEESKVTELFGEPWWKDVDDDLEVIDFYERPDGTEIQMEYPSMNQLRFITILRSGILADPSQRESYGVTKPWPPAETN
jgi:hypothetical protein